MTVTQQIITVAVVVFATMLTRYIPFVFFPAGKPTPKYISYLRLYSSFIHLEIQELPFIVNRQGKFFPYVA